MKKIVIILIASLFTLTLSSQDLILTKKPDSINCKITKINKEFIYFTFKHKTGTRNTMLALSDVEKYVYNFYEQAELPSYVVEKIIEKEKTKVVRLAINSGYSYRTAKIADGLDPILEKYIKDLKSSYHFGADVAFYPSHTYGAGLKFNMCKSSGRLNNVVGEDSSGNMVSGSIEDHITLIFIGPSLSMRYVHGKKDNVLLLNNALGYLGYSNDAVVFDESFNLSSSTFSTSMDLGYDFGLTKDLYLGIQLSATTGILKSIKKNDGNSVQNISLDKDSWENLHRIDASIGIRYWM